MISLMTQISMLAVLLNCSMPTVDNVTTVPMMERDYKAVQANMRSCARWYDENYCMTTFTKTGLNNYSIKCTHRRYYNVQIR